MYTRADITLEDRMEIFSRYWRYQGDYGVVSQLAVEWRTSRRFIYDVAERARRALDWRRPGRPERESTAQLEALRQRVRELEADREQLAAQLTVEREGRRAHRTRLLLELALAPVSEDKIAQCMAAAFGAAGRCSVGWVSGRLQRAGEAALRVMNRAEVRGALREAALDELFRHRQPILTLVEPRTLMAVVPEPAQNRQGETWQQTLAQYPHLRHVISDQASGLARGVELDERALTHQYDLFHFKRELRRELRRLEARCYDEIEAVERARKLVGGRRMLSSAQVQAAVEYRAKAAALDQQLEAFDWTEVIVAYLEEAFTPFDERRGQLRSFASAQAMVDEVLELLGSVREVNTRKLMSLIEGARAGLFTFLQLLGEKLAALPVRWRHIEGSRRALCADLARCWHWRSRAHQSGTCQRKYLLALLNLAHWRRRVENLTEIDRRVCAALDEVVRASSAVECFNSIIRPYISVKKHLSRGFLALIALYWNMHPLAQRGGRTPFELSGVDVGSSDWVEVLEEEMRRLEQPAAVAA